MKSETQHPLPGPYTPTLIIHGGAGNITRENLPPELYVRYEASLLQYLQSAREYLFYGSSALDAAVHAVSLMEDDPLFNCGRGSVFTEKGTTEMEASVMVASMGDGSTGSERRRRGGHDELTRAAEEKRGAGVMLVRNTRHPIQLAREVLLAKPDARASSMHCQLSGPEVEGWGWKERGLERMDDDWFWTKKRWAEHLRGLKEHPVRDSNEFNAALPLAGNQVSGSHSEAQGVQPGEKDGAEDLILPSQGTVGAVGMDSWGDIAVATSTGGLTNKKVGRIGDTPTLGAGFWAESWEERLEQNGHLVLPAPSRGVITYREALTMTHLIAQAVDSGLRHWLYPCLSIARNSKKCKDEQPLLPTEPISRSRPGVAGQSTIVKQPARLPSKAMTTARDPNFLNPEARSRCRVVAISGTGNGDAFLRTAACRTTAAIARFSHHKTPTHLVSLAEAMSMTAGPGGEMQRSAGERWKVTGDGQAGMIGIDFCCEVTPNPDNDAVTASSKKNTPCIATAVSEFNCGGLWRAFIDDCTGKGKVMVFREPYH